MGIGKGVARILRDFSQWTSAHGIPHIGSAGNRCIQIFWAVIFVASASMFAYQMSELVEKYTKYEVTVQTELRFEERTFPAVTICNINPYVKNKAENDSVFADIMAEKAVEPGADSNMTASLTTDLLFIGRALESDGKVDGLSFRLTSDDFTSSVVLSCAYNTKPCYTYDPVTQPNMTDRSDFAVRFYPEYGNCFVFNAGGRYASSRAGPLYGMRILALSNQAQYLPMVKSAGVRIAIHAHDEEPFPNAFGVNAAAGFTTSFGVRFIKTRRLGLPYGNCSVPNTAPDAYFYGTTYTVEGCFRTCSQKEILKHCGCGDARYELPPDSNATYCDVNDTVSRNCIESLGRELLTTCACSQACDESTYGVTVSTSLWPSEVYVPPQCKQDYGTTVMPWKAGADAEATQANCVNWFGENTMMIEVYYERMNYQLLSESPAYTIINLISDMGGQLGLWLGISVITMIEFISLLVLLCIYCVRRPSADQVDTMTSDDDDDVSCPGQGGPVMGGRLGLWLGISVITMIEFISLLVLLCIYCVRRPSADQVDTMTSDDDDDVSCPGQGGPVMGGRLGLWLGISVITMIEFISLLVLLCIYCVRRPSADQVDTMTSDDDDDVSCPGQGGPVMGGRLGLWLGISVITMIEFISLLVLLCIYCVRRPSADQVDTMTSDDDDDVSCPGQGGPVMGGRLGLWLGISVITMIEFISLLVLLCIYCVRRPSADQVDTMTSDDDDDNQFNNVGVK